MCQIPLKCLTSQGTACCRNSNRSCRSLYWKYQSWTQWRVCCRSLHKDLGSSEVTSVNFPLWFSYWLPLSLLLPKCLLCWTETWFQWCTNKEQVKYPLRRNSSRWTKNGKATKIAWYFKATLAHSGKRMRICWEKTRRGWGGGWGLHYQYRWCVWVFVGEVAVPLDSIFPDPSSPWLTL